MVDYLEMLESDPDPHISPEYDWHLAGGNLEVLNIKGKNVLVQPSMRDSLTIRLLHPSANLKTIEFDPKTKPLYKNYGYEIMSSESFVGIRGKKKVNFISREDITKDAKSFHAPIEFKWSDEIAASCLNNDHLHFIDVKNSFCRSHLERKMVTIRFRLPVIEPKNQFPVSLGAIDDNVISYTDLKSMNLVDLRDEKVNPIITSADLHILCEEFSQHKKSHHDNLLYLASSHLLYGIDYRQPKGAVLQWTHQLVNQPSMLKTVMTEDDEVICLSSNSPGDLKVFNCTSGDYEEGNLWSINHLPEKPRTIAQSYHRMKEKGRLLLSEEIKHRTQLFTTGIAMIPNNKRQKVELFVQNSLGDVFKSNLYYAVNNDDGQELLERNFELWHKALNVIKDPDDCLPLKERLKNPEMQFTDVVNLKGISKVLRCEKLEKDEDDASMGTSIETNKVPAWKMNLSEAQEYRDVLSQHLLTEWDLAIEESQPPLFAEALQSSEFNKTPSNKVSKWLETMSNVGEESVVVKKKICDVKIEDYQMFTQDLPATQRTDVSKKSKKPSTRVKGF